MSKQPKITSQHTYTFNETGESITVYLSDTEKEFCFGLSFSHKGINIKWTKWYQGILQIQSKVNSKIWFIYLTPYWAGGNDITTERVMMVCDCNYKHEPKHNPKTGEIEV